MLNQGKMPYLFDMSQTMKHSPNLQMDNSSVYPSYSLLVLPRHSHYHNVYDQCIVTVYMGVRVELIGY